ncbi:monodechloroaminopyrrolnitrin synthase PrnB family protein [Nocardia wallacei]|uniref:monodechloroaminopyrrolnitrin synthase PrnB family protein n=1 Tax=Nocardia wallacei TaxID=480035 RepID=UPI0024556A37|nr:monodechloroaminopyrrolnitrin synthase PrnB family protein [Nocardia wallacei]
MSREDLIPSAYRDGLARACMVSLREDHTVAAADPFDADEPMSARLASWNEESACTALIELAGHMVERLHRMRDLDWVSAAGCMRDLGFVAASLIRHGAPIEAVAGLEPALLRLGRATDEVPRDTVYSYATRNPDGPRRRTFTAHPQERLFIDAVTEGMHALGHTIEQLEFAGAMALGSDASVHHIEQAAVHLRRMIRAIRSVIQNLSPELFTYELRPYFPPMRLGGEVYFGPGGAQMPLLVVDVMLFGSDWSTGPELEAYLEANAAYLPAPYRRLVDAYLHVPSMLSAWIVEARRQAAAGVPRHRPLEALRAVEALLKALLRFRHPHLNLARSNFKIRPPESLGSGGYQVDSLTMLIEQTTRAQADLHTTITALEAG